MLPRWQGIAPRKLPALFMTERCSRQRRDLPAAERHYGTRASYSVVSIPKFLPVRPASRQPLGDQDIADVAALDRDRGERPAVAVGAECLDRERVAVEQIEQPRARLFRQRHLRL